MCTIHFIDVCAIDVSLFSQAFIRWRCSPFPRSFVQLKVYHPSYPFHCVDCSSWLVNRSWKPIPSPRLLLVLSVCIVSPSGFINHSWTKQQCTFNALFFALCTCVILSLVPLTSSVSSFRHQLCPTSLEHPFFFPSALDFWAMSLQFWRLHLCVSMVSTFIYFNELALSYIERKEIWLKRKVLCSLKANFFLGGVGGDLVLLWVLLRAIIRSFFSHFAANAFCARTRPALRSLRSSDSRILTSQALVTLIVGTEHSLPRCRCQRWIDQCGLCFIVPSGSCMHDGSDRDCILLTSVLLNPADPLAVLFLGTVVVNQQMTLRCREDVGCMWHLYERFI